MFSRRLADNLDKTKVTGIQPVDKLQDGVNETLAGQVGQGGLFQPVGDSLSKEGMYVFLVSFVVPLGNVSRAAHETLPESESILTQRSIA